MSDVVFVAAAYLVVLGGLVGYSISLARRRFREIGRVNGIESRRGSAPELADLGPALEDRPAVEPRSK